MLELNGFNDPWVYTVWVYLSKELYLRNEVISSFLWTGLNIVGFISDSLDLVKTRLFIRIFFWERVEGIVCCG